MKRLISTLPLLSCFLLTSCFEDLTGQTEDTRRKVKAVDQEVSDLNTKSTLLRDKVRDIRASISKTDPEDLVRKDALKDAVKQLQAAISSIEPKLDAYKAEAATYIQQNR